MKKMLPPPENWQDFESLCKKLFGEIWKCSHTIKKNGRLGQPQAGVDVYGKPAGETEYWGIQCKGKDAYENKRLTQKEIDEEVAKALLFKPSLKTFIFATTASKDVHIEEYVRLKDQEISNEGGFEIVLYCWQDIVDLIEENRDTYQWYVNNIQFKERFDISISACGTDNGDILRPKFRRTTKQFFVTNDWVTPIWADQLEGFGNRRAYMPLFGSGEINHAWCKINIVITNTGSVVLEDWKVNIQFPDSVRDIGDGFPNNPLNFNEIIKYRTRWADKEQRLVLYKPLNNAPLIQKDAKSFECHVKLGAEAAPLKFTAHLLARDFDRKVDLELNVAPEFHDEIERIGVSQNELRSDEVVISDFTEQKK